MISNESIKIMKDAILLEMLTSDTDTDTSASVSGKVHWLTNANRILTIDGQVCEECNGFGVKIVTSKETNADYKYLWTQKENKKPSGDGTHAITCLDCLGHGREMNEIMF